MARRKAVDKWEVPETVVQIVKAFCADYSRRAKALSRHNVSDDTVALYVKLNSVIDAALEEVEEGIRQIMLTDIQLGRGYDFSPASPFLAKNTYYQRKRKIVHKIAKSLLLF